MTFKKANEFTLNSYFHCKKCRRLVSKLIVLNTDPKTSIVNEMLLMVDEHKSGEFIGIFRFQHNKIGEKFDSSQFKTILAVLLLLVGIAIAYDAFFVEQTIEVVNENNGAKLLSPFAKFIKDISINTPVLYGMFSIFLALILGVGAAIVRRFLSNFRKSIQSAKNK